MVPNSPDPGAAAAPGEADGPPTREAARRWSGYGWLTAAILCVHVGLLLYGSWIHSPNDLEVNLLPAGYVHLRYGRFDIAQVNPPLSRMLCSLPLLGFEVDEDWKSFENRADLRIEYEFGRDFVRRNVALLRPMFFACRAVAALFSVLGAMSVALIALRLYGRAAALVAVALWCFCPMVLGHGATTNHDVPAAALLAATFVAWLAFREQPNWLRSALLGWVAGLACLTRTTCIPVVGLWLIAWGTGIGDGPKPRRQARGQLFTAAAGVTLLVFNAGYGFSGTMTRLGEYTFFSEALTGHPRTPIGGNRFRGTILARLPVPLPRDFVQGLDLQQRDFESPPFDSYLLGEWRSHGWRCYYLVGWAVKTPVGFQVLCIAGVMAALRRAWMYGAGASETWLLTGGALIYGLASWQSGFTIHYRYVLPAWPLLAVAAGGVMCGARRAQWRPVLVATALIAGVVESLLASPHHIDFFNVWIGGSRQGPHYLLHSSCDWGQDVYLALDWQRKVGETTSDAIFLLTYGAVTPEMLDIESKPVPGRSREDHRRSAGEEEFQPGLYGISTTHLFAQHGRYAYLRSLEPIGSLGAALRIYRLTARDIETLRLNDEPPLEFTVLESTSTPDLPATTEDEPYDDSDAPGESPTPAAAGKEPEQPLA